MNIIREKISVHRPKLVLMYGKGQKRSWNQIAGREFPEEKFIVLGGTVLAYERHPANGGPSRELWAQFGNMLRSNVQAS